MEPATHYDGIKDWIQVHGVFHRRYNVYKVVGTSDQARIIHFEDFRTKYPHKRHCSAMTTPYFKPFLIPGGKK
jgi:hypothetical protein